MTCRDSQEQTTAPQENTAGRAGGVFGIVGPTATSPVDTPQRTKREPAGFKNIGLVFLLDVESLRCLHWNEQTLNLVVFIASLAPSFLGRVYTLRTYCASAFTHSMADLPHRGQPLGRGILGGIALAAILPPAIDGDYHDSLISMQLPSDAGVQESLDQHRVLRSHPARRDLLDGGGLARIFPTVGQPGLPGSLVPHDEGETDIDHAFEEIAHCLEERIHRRLGFAARRSSHHEHHGDDHQSRQPQVTESL